MGTVFVSDRRSSSCRRYYDHSDAFSGQSRCNHCFLCVGLCRSVVLPGLLAS